MKERTREGRGVEREQKEHQAWSPEAGRSGQGTHLTDLWAGILAVPY